MYYDLDYLGTATVTGAADGKYLGDPSWDGILEGTVSEI